MRRLLIRPALWSPRAVSCISSRMPMLRFVVAITYLQNFTGSQRNGQLPIIKTKQLLCHLLEYPQLVPVDVGPLALAEAIEEEPALRHFRSDDGSRSATIALARQCDSIGRAHV